MRFVAYGVRDDERAVFEAWSSAHGVECTLLPEPLSAETVGRAAGSAGVTDLMAHPHGEDVYRGLREAGVTALSLRSVGVNGLDLGLARRHGVRIANVPSYSPNAIAEFAVAQSLVLLRHLELQIPRAAIQDYRLDGLRGRELRDQTVGVLGVGHIGSVAAGIFRGFGARVLGYDPVPTEAGRRVLEYRDRPDDLLAEATLLAIFAPLTPATRHLIDAAALARLPAGALLVNVGRGAVVDSAALLDALTSGHLAGAALDVYEHETGVLQRDLSGRVVPDPVFRALATLPNVVVTPHMAFYTDHAVRNMVGTALDNLWAFATRGACENEVTGG